MSLHEIQELRRQLEKEKRLREDDRRLREQAEQSQIHAEEQLRLQTQATTLPEFLDACHVHLFLSLAVQKYSDSTTGDPANADRKLRPAQIREWTSFPNEQVSIWEDLMDTAFATERHFTPLLALQEYGKETRGRMVGSELDLSYFQRQTVESRVAAIVQQLHANPRLRQIFCLNGDIIFENHANTLTDESTIVADMNSLSLTQRQPRRSDRLTARSRRGGRSAQPPAQPPGGGQNATQPRSSRPRADQFCVYNQGPEVKVPAFIIEYKAPHKVTLAHIKAGLQDMDLDKVLCLQKEESPEDVCRRTVAAVITQTFSYMVHGGLEYGYVCTGEAFIFLRVPDNDPSTVYYYLSVPGEDVGPTTGWMGDLNGDNRLHLTALGQVLAFTLRALQVPVRDTAWTNWAARKLQTWEMVYDDLLDGIAEENIPSSSFKPSTRSRNEYCRASPVKTRSKSAVVASCNSSQLLGSLDDDDDGDAGEGFDPDTPSRRRPRLPRPSASSSLPAVPKSQGSRSEGQPRKYCTQKCLLGLIKGGELDQKCPNVSDHGIGRHQLNRTTLIRRLNRQLSNDNLQPDSKLGCESLHMHGTRGALFKITLWSHGYTCVGKGAPVEFVEGSKREELVYSYLTPVQGISVPVLLGSLRLRRPFYYDGIAEIVHLMLMGYAGRKLARQHDLDRSRMVQQAENSLQAIHNLGVLHRDPIPGNLIWNEENGRVMFIDFERAAVQNRRRVPLGCISPNQNGRWKLHPWKKSPNERPDCFELEKQRMIRGL